MKILRNVTDHFAGQFRPLLKLLGALPECVCLIGGAAWTEFNRVLKAATGPKK